MKIRALVFDDDDLIRSLLKTIFEDRGYEVFAYSIPGACPLYRNPEFYCKEDNECADIIISDLRMPNDSGVDLIEKLRKKGCKVKNIALMSGYWTQPSMHRAEEFGCKVFNKPFSMEEIEAWLDVCEKSIDPNRVLSNWFQSKNVIFKNHFE